MQQVVENRPGLVGEGENIVHKRGGARAIAGVELMRN